MTNRTYVRMMRRELAEAVKAISECNFGAVERAVIRMAAITIQQEDECDENCT